MEQKTQHATVVIQIRMRLKQDYFTRPKLQDRGAEVQYEVRKERAEPERLWKYSQYTDQYNIKQRRKRRRTGKSQEKGAGGTITNIPYSTKR